MADNVVTLKLADTSAVGILNAGGKYAPIEPRTAVVGDAKVNAPLRVFHREDVQAELKDAMKLQVKPPVWFIVGQRVLADRNIGFLMGDASAASYRQCVSAHEARGLSLYCGIFDKIDSIWHIRMWFARAEEDGECSDNGDGMNVDAEALPAPSHPQPPPPPPSAAAALKDDRKGDRKPVVSVRVTDSKSPSYDAEASRVAARMRANRSQQQPAAPTTTTPIAPPAGAGAGGGGGGGGGGGDGLDSKHAQAHAQARSNRLQLLVNQATATAAAVAAAGRVANPEPGSANTTVPIDLAVDSLTRQMATSLIIDKNTSEAQNNAKIANACLTNEQKKNKRAAEKLMAIAHIRALQAATSGAAPGPAIQIAGDPVNWSAQLPTAHRLDCNFFYLQSPQVLAIRMDSLYQIAAMCGWSKDKKKEHEKAGVAAYLGEKRNMCLFRPLCPNLTLELMNSRKACPDSMFVTRFANASEVARDTVNMHAEQFGKRRSPRYTKDLEADLTDDMPPLERPFVPAGAGAGGGGGGVGGGAPSLSDPLPPNPLHAQTPGGNPGRRT